MAELTSIERIKLENLFEMSSGYVLDFSNRTFQEFILENTYRDIYDDAYSFKGDSKANRLRAFWQKEQNYIVSKLIIALLEYWQDMMLRRDVELDSKTADLYSECQRIAEKLQLDGIGEGLDSILQPDINDKDFALLAKSIRESIEKNEPEGALDRLHTYVFKYIRNLCDNHGITYDKNKPLHSCYGEYVKYLRVNNLIESEMAERILKYAITLLDAFNDVRNNRSFAHDNKVLNYNESMLIFKNVSSIIAFIESIESSLDKQNGTNNFGKNELWNNIPF